MHSLHIPPNSQERLLAADNRIAVMPTIPRLEVDGEVAKWATPDKVQILTELALAQGNYVPSYELAERVYGAANSTNRGTVIFHICEARKHLGPELGDKRNGAIRTKREDGYRLVDSLNGTPRPPIIGGHELVYAAADERIIVDGLARAMFADGKLIGNITAREFQLAEFLVRFADMTHSHAKLQDYIKSKSLKIHMSNLRRKVGSELGDPYTGAFQTHVGVGYIAVSSL